MAKGLLLAKNIYVVYYITAGQTSLLRTSQQISLSKCSSQWSETPMLEILKHLGCGSRDKFTNAFRRRVVFHRDRRLIQAFYVRTQPLKIP